MNNDFENRLRDLEKQEEQLKNALKEFAKDLDADLEARRRLLDNASKNQIELYSNSIRNIGIISGVVAPLSLSLLTVDRLEINIVLLVLGFIFLISNIIFSQLCLDIEIGSKDKKLSQADFEWISASTSKYVIENESGDLMERTKHMTEYLNSISKIDELMRLKAFDINLKITNLKLRKYNKWINIIFSIGSACIVFSTFYNYLIDYLLTVVSKLSSLL